MKRRLFMVFLMVSLVSFAQKKKEEKTKIDLPTKQILREGNASYNQNDFATAEENYKKALELNPNYEKANYNLGNSIYQQKRFKEAVPMYDLATKTTKDKVFKAENYHNIGNAMMKQKKYAEAIKAYKNALRNNSKDDETRYNLALAQKMLKNQADNKKDDKNNKDKNDKNKDKKKKDKKDDKNNKKNKDEGDGDKDKDKKGDNKKDPNKDKKGESDKKKKQPQQPQKNQLSKQQIKQLLEAMNNEENKTQKKINARKAKGRKIKQEKDW